jgi:hypothetical protein
MNELGNESENEGCYMYRSAEHYARECELKEEILGFGKNYAPNTTNRNPRSLPNQGCLKNQPPKLR